MADVLYDVIVIGAGPAGLAAAMFTARRGLKTAIVSKDLGGQLALTEWIENYPGVDRLGGRELCERFLAQVKRDGAEFRFGEAVAIEPSTPGVSQISNLKSPMKGWVVRTAEGEELTTRTVILAFGLTPNDLGCEGEGRLKGKGVYYSAVNDAPKQDGEIVAVVGGGNSAVTAVLELAPRATKVLLIHRRAELRAEKPLLERLHQLTNVEIRTPFAVASLDGGDWVERMTLLPTDPTTGTPIIDNFQTPDSKFQIPVNSVFVQIGFSAKTKWLEGVVQLNERREVVVDRDCRTSVPGIFAAGDLTDIAYKQAAISTGEGVKAALQTFKYLQGIAGRPAVMFDWDHS
ncbi:MAG: FAD-dependent oxidoreductase [bacterium]|nr:FAD-dependent oxidoreductase [bacterium]